MKSTSLILLALLCSAPALSADVTYGGPYAQLKVKLCSDTPPSRSLLPDGSLICDDNPPKSDSYCTASWNYADTDIFNCGSQDSNREDWNNNGIPDSQEDWDGDGISNGRDSDPYTPENPIKDENDNGIPDELEAIYDDLLKTQEILYCNTENEQCQSMRSVMKDLADNNATLASAIRNASLYNVRRNDFNQSIGALTSNVNTKTDDILTAIDSIDVSSADNSVEIENLKWFLNDRVSETTGTNAYKLNGLGDDIETNSRKLDSLSNKLDSTSFGGLTYKQETQLKNAAKASTNNRLLRSLSADVSSLSGNVANVRGDISSLDGHFSSLDGQFQALDGQFQALDGQFAQLNYKLDNFDVGDVSVDLSGVESGLTSLGEKIDGLNNGDGGNSESLEEIAGTLNEVKGGVDNLGDLLQNVDTSTAGTNGTCIETSTCQGFYQSNYEGGLSDVVTKQLQDMKTSVVDPFVSSFGTIDLSGAKRPNFGLPVPFYGYFSFDDFIDLDSIFGFLRFIFLASTAFYCRQIIFGG